MDAASPVPPTPAVLTDPQKAELQAELARLRWGLDFHGGAGRLDARMKIQDVQRRLRAAGVAEA